jgi:RecA-family ATPase
MLDLKLEKHGRVVLLAAEDSHDALHHRLFEMGAHLSPAQRQCVAEKFHIADCVGSGIDLLDKEWFDRIKEQAQDARLLVIDTLTRFHGLDENNAQDAKKIMSAMEKIAAQTGCAILFIHHTNKSSAMNGMADLQQAARGSSVFVDNARWLAFVAGMTKDEAAQHDIRDEERKKFIKWNISKQNYGAPMPDRWLKRSRGGVLLAIELQAAESKQTKNKWRDYD